MSMKMCSFGCCSAREYLGPLNVSFFHFLLIMNKLHCPTAHCQCLCHVTLIINWSLSNKIDTEAWDSLIKASFVTCGVAIVCGSASKISSH